jgi:hypothetical protein
MLAAAEKNLPIVVPGWEDSTMGNIFASYVMKKDLKATTMKSGIEYMGWLADWYIANSSRKRSRLFPDWWWNCRRFSNLCSSNACIRIWKWKIFLSGVISVRSQILQLLTDLIQELYRMKRLPGVNWISILQNLLLNRMQPLWHHSSLHGC